MSQSAQRQQGDIYGPVDTGNFAPPGGFGNPTYQPNLTGGGSPMEGLSTFGGNQTGGGSPITDAGSPYGQSPIQWGGGNPWFNNSPGRGYNPQADYTRSMMPGGYGQRNNTWFGSRYNNPNRGGGKGGGGGGNEFYAGSAYGNDGVSSAPGGKGGSSRRPYNPYTGSPVDPIGSRGIIDSGGSSGKGGNGNPILTGGIGTAPTGGGSPLEGGGGTGGTGSTGGGSPTNQGNQGPLTATQWAQQFAAQHPELQGQQVNLLDYFTPGADGSMAGLPILNGWENQLSGRTGFTGWRDGIFFQNGRDVIGQINGTAQDWYTNPENRRLLGTQGFNVNIPMIGPGTRNGASVDDPRFNGVGTGTAPPQEVMGALSQFRSANPWTSQYDDAGLYNQLRQNFASGDFARYPAAMQALIRQIRGDPNYNGG